MNRCTSRKYVGVALGVSTLASFWGAAVAQDALVAQDGEAAAPDPTRWKTTATLAAALTRGNSETVTLSGAVDTQKKWGDNELSMGAGVVYGEERNTVTASNLTGYGQYNRLFTERLFGYARVDAFHDDVANIAYRLTFSPGAGYYFIKNDKFTLNAEVGPGYVLEKFHNLDQEDYMTIRFSENFTWAISETSRLWQSASYVPKIDEWDNFFLEAEVGIATKITKSLDLRVVANYNHRSRPAPDRKKDDFRLLAGVGYTF